jgi:hypothetical protein
VFRRVTHARHETLQARLQRFLHVLVHLLVHVRHAGARRDAVLAGDAREDAQLDELTPARLRREVRVRVLAVQLVVPEHVPSLVVRVHARDGQNVIRLLRDVQIWRRRRAGGAGFRGGVARRRLGARGLRLCLRGERRRRRLALARHAARGHRLHERVLAEHVAHGAQEIHNRARAFLWF